MTPRRVLRPAALRAIPRDRSVVIEASAGTGKTFAIEHLIVDLLLSTQATLDSILVVTFTEKATAELRSRVRAKLDGLRFEEAGDSDEAKGAEQPADFWLIDDAARAKLDAALHAFDGASITTIHAFCQRLLREQSFASGRMFDERQVDGRDAFARAMRDALRRDVACDERRAVWLEAALRTGWSIARVEDLLWRCLQSRGDLQPTYDADALGRALASFPIQDARSQGLFAHLRSWGLHGTTANKVVTHLRALSDAVEQAIAGRDATSFVVRSQELRFDYLLEKLPARPPASGAAARVCLAARDLAYRTPTFASSLAQALLPPVLAELGTRKREAGQYDFDDMLVLVDEALRGELAVPLTSAMRKRWRHVLIDESQDTDETQWSIFRRGFLDPPGPSTLCLVGDPKQSIYRFRGADVHTYLRARGEIETAGGARVTLDCNYRSSRELVSAYNAIFDQNAPTPIFTGDLEYSPLTCGRPDRVLVDGTGAPVKPVHVWRFAWTTEATAFSALGERMAKEIRELVDPSRPWRLDGRGLDYSDVFVLTRAAREGRALAAALREARIPHTFYKQDGLFQTDEAREIHALLLAIDNPNDRARRLAAWLTPFFGISLASIERARDVPTTHPLVARLRTWKALADRREFDAMFESVVQDSGVFRREIFFADGERELTNYQQIIEHLVEYAHGTTVPLRDLTLVLGGLIAGTRLPLDVEGSVQRLESERPAVQVMTIHKAKGLEAPIVFVVGGFGGGRSDEVHLYHRDGRRRAWVGPIDDPEVDARVKAEEDEEQQRLMYVALTRAKGRLYLPCAVRETGPGRGDATSLEPKALRGPYDAVNRRIVELLRCGEAPLSVEPLSVDAEQLATPPLFVADAWRPPDLSPTEASHRDAYRSLRRQRAGAFVTSYTRMRGELAAGRATNERVPAGTAGAGVAPGVLRGTRASGILLHHLLERVPLGSFKDSAPSSAPEAFDVWRHRPDVSSLIDDALVAYRVDADSREHVERMVWGAFTTPLTVSRGDRLAGIAAAANVVREMAFVFPVHDDGPRTFAPTRPARGYVRGSIDLAFEHAGLTYFVDWKSDSLASYSPESLDRHVAAHYATQAQLYAVAVVKLLGLETREAYEAQFGGMLYCFVRAFDGAGQGLWSERPTWNTLVAWEAALAQRAEVGS